MVLAWVYLDSVNQILNTELGFTIIELDFKPRLTIATCVTKDI